MKRFWDILASAIGLLIASPVMIPAMIAIWLQDGHSPFYIAPRVGKNMIMFNMVKLRSMVVNADNAGVDSTSSTDQRITTIGMLIRKLKIDELTQLVNVLLGDMSLVGPRPNVEREVKIYTKKEERLLDVRPGITDLASIVFSDEGDILDGSDDPDLRYNQIIRPWKSRLGLTYVQNQHLWLDLRIILLTVIAIISRPVALKGVNRILLQLNESKDLIDVALRKSQLYPHPPPGTTEIVNVRDGCPKYNDSFGTSSKSAG